MSVMIQIKGTKTKEDFEAFQYKVQLITFGSKVATEEGSGKVATDLTPRDHEMFAGQQTGNDVSEKDTSKIRNHFAKVYHLGPNMQYSRKSNKCIKNFRKKVGDCFKMDYDATVFYFSGPADKSGSWTIESESDGIEKIPPKEFFDLWDERSKKQKFCLIIVDANYSGVWAKEVNAKNDKSIAILTSNKIDEQALYSKEIGSIFTLNLLKYLQKMNKENLYVYPTSNFCMIGDYLLAKKYTNLYINFKTYPEMDAILKCDFARVEAEYGRYIGYINTGQRHFWGLLNFSQGELKDASFNGEFKQGKMCGKGIMMYKDGRKYEGDWDNNMPNGFAEEIYSNGDRYEGQYQNGAKHGHGKYYYANGDVYIGDFKNSLPDGKGKFTKKNGDAYEGAFSKGKSHGKGTMKYANGETYEGDWVENIKQGKGVYTFKNGNVYTGEFSKGVKEGKGIMTSQTGEKKEGTWKDDEIVAADSFVTATGQVSFHANDKAVLKFYTTGSKTVSLVSKIR